MAIDAYVGLPGHGKSYGVTEHVIVPSLKDGRKIVTNIPLNEKLLMEHFGDAGGEIVQLPLDWHEMNDLGEVATPGAVLVLDEVWRRWPSGETVKQAKFEDQQLLAEHRHRVDDEGRSMRIVLVTQDLAQISNWVRLLVESTFRIAKKSKRLYVVTIYNGAVTGVRPPKSAVLRQVSGTFKKDIFQFYSSATQSATGAVGDESTADGRASIFKSFGLLASSIGGVVMLVLGGYGLVGFFSPDEPKSVIQSPALLEVKSEIPDSEPLQPNPIKPITGKIKYSDSWRVSGYIHGEGPGVSRVALSSVDGTRFIALSDCEFYESGIDIFCDIDGERVTPWTGNRINGGVFGSARITPMKIQPQSMSNSPKQAESSSEEIKTRVTVIPHSKNRHFAW